MKKTKTSASADGVETATAPTPDPSAQPVQEPSTTTEPSTTPDPAAAEPKPKKTSASSFRLYAVMTHLETSLRVQDTVCYDEMAEQVVRIGPLGVLNGLMVEPAATAPQAFPRLWTDHNDTDLTAYLERRLETNLPTGHIRKAVSALAKRHRPIHPIRDYLTSLPEWDGVARLDHWLEKVCYAPDSEYVRTVGRKWLISGVARPMIPGCKADSMLVLEGEQGLKKSWVFKILAGKWFCDSLTSLAGKDSLMILNRSWIVESGEMWLMQENLSRLLKAFVTRQIDTFRPPYGAYATEKPRHCIFAGTTNEDQYLTDETGNRRFWPIPCPGPKLDIEWLEKWRDLLWAEALVAYRAGEPWHLDDRMEALAGIEQAKRMDLPVYADEIGEWLAENKPELVKPQDLLNMCPALFGLRNDLRTLKMIGKVLRFLGWKRDFVWIGGKTVKGYVPPTTGNKGNKMVN